MPCVCIVPDDDNCNVQSDKSDGHWTFIIREAWDLLLLMCVITVVIGMEFSQTLGCFNLASWHGLVVAWMVYTALSNLQCIDAVGWAAGRASGL